MDNLFGRTIIYSNVEAVDRENVVSVIQKAYSVHQTNQSQIDYLYNYYKGRQPILERQKTVRPDINYMIVENRAKEIVDFKTGYLIGDPILYIGKGDASDEDIRQLNDIMSDEDKFSKDEELIEWGFICGTSYRMVLQNDDPASDSPIRIYTLDPRQTFVVYSSDFAHEPLAAVYFVVDSENQTVYNVYTKDRYFKIVSNEIVEEGVNGIGLIPIIEYPANNARLGAFEVCINMLDAINLVDSDRVNAVAQFVQSLIVATNCDFEDGVTAEDMMAAGIVSLTSKDGLNQDLKILTQELNQTQTQTLKDDMYTTVLTIVSMPNRTNGRTYGDTGVAVMYRDGWSAAETSAKKSEVIIIKSEKQFLRVVFAITGSTFGPDLSIGDVEIKFTRRNFEYITQKAEVLNMMLDQPKIAPRLAFIYSNMFPDPEEAYRESLPYIKSAEQTDEINREVQTQETEKS